MTIQIDRGSDKQDLSMLAIEAAEELERWRRKLPTDFRSVNILSSLLQKSFSQKVDEPGFNPRLDHASVFSNAITNSFGSTVTKKTISEVATEAVKIASILNSENMSSKEDELEKLKSFCVALSDSAALYKEELEELKKHLA